MAREIRELRPELPVLFMSGYAEEQLRREIDIADMHFLAKPFSVAADRRSGRAGAAGRLAVAKSRTRPAR